MAGLTGNVCVVVIYKKARLLRPEHTKEIFVAWNRERASMCLWRWLKESLGGRPFRSNMSMSDGELGGFRWEFFDKHIEDY